MKFQWPVRKELWQTLGKRYWPALLVASVGVLLMMLPTGRTTVTAEPETEEPCREAQVEELEGKLARILSQVQGAGEVQVVLTLDSGTRQILAQNVEQDGEAVAREAVTLGKGNGEETVPLQTFAPQFRGALVVCPGGDDPSVRLALLKAVTALTGLGADRVCVCCSVT